jgi:transglutaminase-like putative cysteine protease
MAALFTAIMRANGMPCRRLIGRLAASSTENQKLNGKTYSNEHVMAEVFIDDVGWLPVDPARKSFGADDGSLVVTAVDAGVRVDLPLQKNFNAGGLQNPAYFVFGNGDLTARTESRWDVSDFK